MSKILNLFLFQATRFDLYLTSESCPELKIEQRLDLNLFIQPPGQEDQRLGLAGHQSDLEENANDIKHHEEREEELERNPVAPHEFRFVNAKIFSYYQSLRQPINQY